MRRRNWLLGGFLVCGLMALPARAEFIISNAILEFNAGGPRQQDIELVSRSEASDYVVTEVSKILDPGLPTEKRELVGDPQQGGLLVTPEKTVLAPGARKLLRFVLLREPDAQEHVYRVTVKPVIKGVDNASKVGLKVLIGYEALVIVRPAKPVPAYTVVRNGRTLSIANTGNTNVLFQNGAQCPASEGCELPPALRVYPGQKAQVELPLDKTVTYTVWDGVTNVERHVP